MKVAIVAPSPVPFTRGGAERAVAGLQRAINEQTPHDCEVVKLPVDESTLPGIVAGYEAFSRLDVSHFDRIVSVKYPAWIVGHDDHTVLMFHPLRGLYDTYHLFGLPTRADHVAAELQALRHVMQRRSDRAVLPELFGLFADALAELGPHHPDFTFPGPLAREIVHWLDAIALAPAQVRRHLALSRTVASRPGYFPPGVSPMVTYLPSDLPPGREGEARHLFTASRLDGPKRLDLLIEAYRRVPGHLPLLIAGTGPEEPRLRTLAAGDERVQLLGFVPDGALLDLYADALAVPFVPLDEDLGLVTLEAFGCATPVVTCRDSGGPTELVVDGVTGLLAEPTPESLGKALTRLVRDPALARQLGRAGNRRGAKVTWLDAVRTILDDHRRTPRAARSSSAAAPVRAISHGGAPGSRRPRVVVLATFRVDDPVGGGRLRCYHLYGALARHADVEVVSLVEPFDGAASWEIRPGLVQTMVPRSPAQVDVGVELSGRARMPVTDIVAGTHIWTTPAYLDTLRAAARGADLVLLAEPYLHPALAAAGVSLPFVYDAFNVEADLKASVLPATPIGRDLLARVIAVERAAVRGAAAVTACSAPDAAALAKHYAISAADVTVIPNGTDTATAVLDPERRRAAARRWRDRFVQVGTSGRQPAHLAVFFASWHPPNLDAARLIVDLAPDLPDTLFVCAGSHGDAFRSRRLPRNVVFPGVIGNRSKSALLACADVALNPMRTGSGTNLKLIEYLSAGVPVVSTAFGARGVEVVGGEHLLLADADGFSAAIRACLDDPAAAHQRALAGRALAVARYDWQALGDRLADVVERVVHAPAAAS
ncbi:MAG: putative glycosyltransferase [Acidimicrobiales bacterium]|nr:putative glycosyltransferase [Acidimicrobiales bacterium]